jgi:two-component system, cell cycle sensor histidine kinase and response regulator CckA
MESTLRRFLGAGITFEIRLDPDIEVINADPNQIEQVILNLVSNACDAMPHGGLLTISAISARNNTVEAVRDPDQLWIAAPNKRTWNHVALEIQDTGCGMSSDVLAHAFEPFFTTKEIGKGTGLGLSTVFGIVQEFDGDIQVTSSVGHGSRFRLCFPVDLNPIQEPVQTPLEKEPELDGDGRETILLVEDEDMVRDMLKEVLLMHGYEVHVAEHGKEALQLYKEQDGQFDLVLTDVVMPMMNGRELAEAILKISPNQSILYLSGYSDGDMLRHGLLESNSAFLQKPFRTETLLAKLREMLDKKSEGDIE